jgi:hypothetical protein
MRMMSLAVPWFEIIGSPASLVVWMLDLPQTRPWQQTLLMQDDCRGQGRS